MDVRKEVQEDEQVEVNAIGHGKFSRVDVTLFHNSAESVQNY